jgi:UDP-N-acetylglucosamine 2-epimerase (non-hydrolysing)
MKIISVVGARPNFMKIAPFIKAINKHNEIVSNQDKIMHMLVHTGQHYDDRMSKLFFEALDIPEADINLEVGSGSHAEQVGKTMIAFEDVLLNEKPDWVVVVGDVNATLACSVTAKKLHIKVCHIEAGLRSGDMNMPEEINRLVTDRISDLLLTPDRMSNENLYAEGTDKSRIVFVGNIMIDTLNANKAKAAQLPIKDIITENLLDKRQVSIQPNSNFAIVTLHRPSNVDDKTVLSALVDFLISDVASLMPIVWTIHPRTKVKLNDFDLLNKLDENENIYLMQPLGYHELLRLNMSSKVVLTDSGGLQEECTVLGTPCLTMRWNTERPVTLVEHGGVSILVGNNVERIREEFNQICKKEQNPVIPELWDGNTAQRCLQAIVNYQK